MTKSRSLAIALALQVAALLSLSQTWFVISMTADDSLVQLGAFDGASAYPAAASLSLLNLAALSIVAISSSKTRAIAIAITTVSSLAALVVILPMALNRDVSALDGQLDRLTGIANTHGLQSLDISSSAFVVFWVASTLFSFIFSAWLLRSSREWSNEDRAAISTQQSNRVARKAAITKPKSSIDLWDDQRQ